MGIKYGRLILPTVLMPRILAFVRLRLPNEQYYSMPPAQMQGEILLTFARGCGAQFSTLPRGGAGLRVGADAPACVPGYRRSLADLFPGRMRRKRSRLCIGQVHDPAHVHRRRLFPQQPAFPDLPQPGSGASADGKRLRRGPACSTFRRKPAHSGLCRRHGGIRRQRERCQCRRNKKTVSDDGNAQSADKATTAKIAPINKEIGGNFCFLRQLHLHPWLAGFFNALPGC